MALNVNTGKILWQTFSVVPDNGGRPDGYSGGAIWQPPAIDVERGSLYVGTGNNYEVPQTIKDCLATATGAAQSGCFAANDYFDTALALDLKTGRVKWSKRVQGLDVWTVACVSNPNPVSCPEPTSPDYDLSGSGPNLLEHMVGFGQETGWVARRRLPSRRRAPAPASTTRPVFKSSASAVSSSRSLRSSRLCCPLRPERFRSQSARTYGGLRPEEWNLLGI